MIAEHINDLDLTEGETHRGNCPVCHGRNTFTVTNDNGNVLYNCYKAGCNIGGSHHINMSAYKVKTLLSQGLSMDNYEDVLLDRFDLPPYLTQMKQDNANVRNFMTKWHINPDNVLYDVRQDRVVFPVHTPEHVLVDAVGRSLDGRNPKWLRYASSPVPYTHGKGTHAVIVEDAISAYVLAEHFPKLIGVALLGTQLTDFHKWFISHFYNQVTVALDPDARDKTLKITKELSFYVPDVKALNITDDLKYMKEEDALSLEEINNGVENTIL